MGGGGGGGGFTYTCAKTPVPLGSRELKTVVGNVRVECVIELPNSRSVYMTLTVEYCYRWHSFANQHTPVFLSGP